jgi:DNA polymerase-4/protein ImuB
LADFLKDIPCDVLPVPPESKEKLHQFGFDTMGQVSALPSGPLQSQFGPEGELIWELANGYDNTPLCPRSMEEVIEESTALLSVTVSIDAILAEVKTLLLRVFAGDILKGRGICSLDLWTKTWDSNRWQKSIRFKEPAMDVRGAAVRINQFLENFPQPGPVEQIGIKLTGLSYGVGRQGSVFTEVRAQESLMEDIKELELRLASPLVFRIKEVEPWSRIPERRFALIPAAGG